MKKASRWIVALLGAVVAPFAILDICMVRFGSEPGHGSDNGFIISIAVGLLSFSSLPLSWRIKLAVSPVYVCGLVAGLFLLGAELACGLYRACM